LLWLTVREGLTAKKRPKRDELATRVAFRKLLPSKVAGPPKVRYR
jgi:hypothetical protein